MTAQFRTANRDQPMLLPPDLRDWVPEDDIVHFIIEATALNSANRTTPKRWSTPTAAN